MPYLKLKMAIKYRNENDWKYAMRMYNEAWQWKAAWRNRRRSEGLRQYREMAEAGEIGGWRMTWLSLKMKSDIEVIALPAIKKYGNVAKSIFGSLALAKKSSRPVTSREKAEEETEISPLKVASISSEAAMPCGQVI